MIRFLLLLSSMYFLQNCATKVDGLVISDDFKHPQIKSGSIVAAGVVDASKATTKDSVNYSQIMGSNFREERKYYPIKDSFTVVNAIGDAEYQKLLKKYRTGGLDQTWLTKLEAKLSPARFISFARIDSNITSKSERETNSREEKDAKGNKRIIPGKIIKMHKRTMSVTLHIYDLKKKNIAFSGQVTKDKENQNSYEKNLVNAAVSVINTFQGKSSDSQYPSPQAPSSRELLNEIFEGFAENLPEED